MLPNGSDWYWALVSGSTSVGFNVDGLATGATSATLQAKLFGYSGGAHETLIYLNDQLLDDTAWFGQGERIATMTFPQSYLSAITNTLRISEAIAPPDYVYFNYFDVSYARAFTATNDTLRFRQTANGAWQYQVKGFSTPSIAAFDISDATNVTRIVGATVTPAGATYTLGFADGSPAPREYIVLADTQRKSPISISADAPSNLASASNGADYIMIAYGGFLANAQPLAARRTAQGMRVTVVDVQDVYDEFSDGLMDAQAIRDFLQYAYANWQPPAPSFVLLVGDGNYDFKDNKGIGEPNFIPPYLRNVDPWLGETASDNRLVAFSLPNTLPSMAIGRLPADNAADMDAMVSKILNYEQNPPPGDWRTKVAFVADNPDNAGDFRYLSDLIAGDSRYFPSPLRADRIYYSTPDFPTVASVRGSIVNAINDGRVIVNYIGHSGYTAWVNEQLFRISEVNTLANGGMLPVMLAMTCFDGYFHQPGLPSIAEMNVRLAGRGALASWSASGFGVATGHDYLDRGFFDAVVNRRIYQLGPATIAGKMNLWLNGGGGNLDLLDTFNLLGDPASRLAILPSATYLPLVTR